MENLQWWINFFRITVLIIGIFLITRKVVLWYWRMDEMADNLKLILAELKKISGKTGQLTQGEN